jgi:hypothetical protein
MNPSLEIKTPFYALWEDNEVPPPAPTARRWISGREAIVQTLEVAERFPGSCDLLLPAEDDITVARRMFSGRLPAIPPRERDNRVLRHLLDTEVPRLSELSVSDVVSIHDDQDAFVLWRDALRRALSAAYADDDTLGAVDGRRGGPRRQSVGKG